MDAIPFELSAHDFVTAGKIRKAIREHVEDRNERDRRAEQPAASVVPTASR